MKNITPIALSISLAISSFAYAEEGFRQHSAHVHGHVELNIAQDGKELLMEISAPGADVVGFEHAPKNSEQKHQLENAITTLKDVNNLFAFPASAGCVALNQSVAHTLEGGDDHDKHDHNEHKHHDEHDHDKHDQYEHKHHDEHDHDEHNGHGEFNIEYSYTCSNISALKNIETQWFKHFSNTKSITVNWLSPDGKISVIELGKGDKTISR
ncbi:zinc uptake protein ZrgA [Vibrio caribbeanicus]|uniref:zinc uptake protein ZrgA n=1 Tax=Vibrio caribbeanicus TaxID=701175 RepID=UPI0030DBEDC9